jgi:diacylglycerol kinase (ATP)
MKSGNSGLRRIIAATGHSMRGLKACWVNEAAFRQNASLFAVLFAAAFPVARNPQQWLLLVVPPFLLLIVELLNSAIETVVDRIGMDHNELSGRAKDMGSAAVFLCLVLIGLCWLVILWANYS